METQKWLSDIQLPFPIMLAYGNHLSTLTYVWKIPDDIPVDNAVVGRIYSQLSKDQSTQAMQCDDPECILDHVHSNGRPKSTRLLSVLERT